MILQFIYYIIVYHVILTGPWVEAGARSALSPTVNLPTKINHPNYDLLTQHCRDMRIPPLNTKIMLESNPPKSRIFVLRSAVFNERNGGAAVRRDRSSRLGRLLRQAETDERHLLG